MKFINKLFFIGAIFFVSSCGLTDLDQLDDPSQVSPDNAQTDLFFNAIQLDLKDMFNTASDAGARVTRQIAMTGGNVYENAFSASSFNFMWGESYARLLPDLNQLISLAETEGSQVPALAGASKILKAYVIMTLVDYFGDVPLSEAGQGVAVLSPKADSQSAIYDEALALLDQAIADLNAEGPSLGASATDLFYGGDQGKWIKLANTLKIKWYMNVGSGNGGFGSEISSAAASAITSSADDFQFNYGTERDNPNSRHPWYNDGYENGAGIYQSNYFMWSLRFEKGIIDPRIRYYFYRQDLAPTSEIDNFTLDCTGLSAPLHYGNVEQHPLQSVGLPYCHVTDGYWGRDHGNNDGIPPDGDRRTVAGVYPSGGNFDSDQSGSSQNSGADGGMGAGLNPIMLSSFTHFMLAEAALTRGTGGDAGALLEEGIRQSIDKVMDVGAGQAVDSLIPDTTAVNVYVNTVMNAFNGASNEDKLDIVMKEYHIALWGNGIESYNGYRRTTYPSNLQPTLEPSSGDFPRLMYYPADYINRNENISTQRALTDQVFWDTNPAGSVK